MSYSFTISGHTSNAHNAKVKEIAEDAYAKVKALHNENETAPSLTGYSGDQTGSITITTPPVQAAAASESSDTVT